MTGAEAVLCAAVLLLSAACVVLAAMLARRAPITHWWCDATLIQEERFESTAEGTTGQTTQKKDKQTRHFDLTIELRPGVPPKKSP